MSVGLQRNGSVSGRASRLPRRYSVTGHVPFWRVLAVSSLALGGCSSLPSKPPTECVDVDYERASIAVVVATVGKGGALPEPAACAGPDVNCMHDPFWFEAELQQTVYGRLPRGKTYITSRGHHGPPAEFERGWPRLMLIMHQPGVLKMPTYAWSYSMLARRKDGEFVIVGDSDQHWLPCGLSEIGEMFDPLDFDVPERPTFDEETSVDGEAVPIPTTTPFRGISMTRLAAFLRQRRPTLDDFACEVYVEPPTTP